MQDGRAVAEAEDDADAVDGHHVLLVAAEGGEEVDDAVKDPWAVVQGMGPKVSLGNH